MKRRLKQKTIEQSIVDEGSAMSWVPQFMVGNNAFIEFQYFDFST